MFRRVITALVLVVVGAVLLLVAWPQLVGLQRAAGVAQVASLRGLLTAIALLVVVLLTIVALLSSRLRSLAGALAVLVLVFAGIQLAVLSTRGATELAPPATQAGDLTVLAWNTLGETPAAEEVAALVAAEGADIVVLPETSEAYADVVVAASGLPFQVVPLFYDEISLARSTVVLISPELGDYVRDDSRGGTDTLPSVLAVPADGTGPTIIGAHPVAPVPGEMDAWRQGLEWLAARCAGDDVILAGDLNSTLDHYTGLDADGGDGLGACRDGARATGNAAVGTWPTVLPGLLGAPIDHVMATPNWEFVGFRVITTLDEAGSDHRPVVATLRPAS